MPAEALSLPDASFDVVLCQFGLMFIGSPVTALREMRRVLRPGGKVGVAVWSVPERVGIFLLARIVMAALPPVAGASCSPLSMGEPGLIEGLVSEVGFRDVSSERQTRSLRRCRCRGGMAPVERRRYESGRPRIGEPAGE